ncbi:hypothetical protein HK098_007423 [Nowakowskiella sp. JEL0407]|nr:hypothetical protein HK098_007423 [Nowakowskiella sp. JEL0407]
MTNRQVSLILRSISPSINLPSPQLRISLLSLDTTVHDPFTLQREYDTKHVFLEFVVKGFVNSALPFPVRCYAVVRIVKNREFYKDKLKSVQKRYEEGYPPILQPLRPQVQLDFDVSGKLINDRTLEKDIFIPHSVYNKYRTTPSVEVDTDNYYQMTASSKLDSRPVWDQYFMFPIDMFNFHQQTSLIIEFYRDPPVTHAYDSNSTTTPTNFSLEFDTNSPKRIGRPINELFAYAEIPLGDFSLLKKTDCGKVKLLDRIQVQFLGKFAELPGTKGVNCCVEFKVPENWDELSPIIPPKQTTKTRKTTKTSPHDLNISDLNNLSDHIPKITNRTASDLLPDLEFEELINMVKHERKIQEESNAEAARRAALASDPTRMTFTYHDITQRQKLIDRLLEELESRTDAVKKVGQEIFALREHNAQMESKIRDQEKIIKEHELKTVQLVSCVDLEGLSGDELRRRYDILLFSQKLQTAINHEAQLKSKLESAQNDLIERLEEYFNSVDVNPDVFDSGLYKLITEENRQLKEKLVELESEKTKMDNVPLDIATLQKELERERKKNIQLQNSKPDISGSETSESKYFSLLMRAETAEARASALQYELLENAKTFARKITSLKSQLLEKSTNQRPLKSPSSMQSLSDAVNPTPTH